MTSSCVVDVRVLVGNWLLIHALLSVKPGSRESNSIFCHIIYIFSIFVIVFDIIWPFFIQYSSNNSLSFNRKVPRNLTESPRSFWIKLPDQWDCIRNNFLQSYSVLCAKITDRAHHIILCKRCFQHDNILELKFESKLIMYATWGLSLNGSASISVPVWLTKWRFAIWSRSFRIPSRRGVITSTVDVI